jgi:hypothetical protein
MEIFNAESYEKYLKGFTIFDCAINTKERFCFLMLEKQEDDDSDIYPNTRFLIIGLDGAVTPRLGYFQSGDFSIMSIARGITPPEYVAVDLGSLVYSSDSARRGNEKPIEDVVDMKTAVGTCGTIRRVVRAAGQIYAVSSYRRLYRRIGIDQWVDIASDGKGVPLPADFTKRKTDWGAELGFEDLSAFNANDMYAVGGYGDVWRFDGKKWHKCPFPTNSDLETVCCAGDGNVYITDAHSSVWVGREDRWQQLVKADINPGYGPVDSVWFKGRLYLGARTGIFVIENKKLVYIDDVDPNAPNAMISGRLDVSPDGEFMLTAGSRGACLFDGTTWTILFRVSDFESYSS